MNAQGWSHSLPFFKFIIIKSFMLEDTESITKNVYMLGTRQPERAYTINLQAKVKAVVENK